MSRFSSDQKGFLGLNENQWLWSAALGALCGLGARSLLLGAGTFLLWFAVGQLSNRLRLTPEKRRERREKEILRKCGCVCYCECGRPLNDQACEPVGDGETYRYTCGCGEVSEFNFAVAPVPIRTR